ncbi:MAG: glycogen/starch/alpha-glucan phosphorylase, partial [Ruminococcus sp.]|nr:glycogen/starch/alpha-glucan phosphorylase [Ruminococcus sp.]
MDKNLFAQALEKDLLRKYDTTVEKASDWQLHECVSSVVMELVAAKHAASLEKHLSGRRAMYLSMEFLMGRAVHNNIFCEGIYDEVESVLNAHGRSLDDLETIEDAALGNGGLGRLAACFLDSAATLDLPLDGYGI